MARTLSAELTAAQRASANTPHQEIVFLSRDGATTTTYKSDDGTNRIVSVRADEGFYGGGLFEIQTPSGQIIPISAQIIMRNGDNEFTSKDLRGFKVDIGWGFASYLDGSSTVTITGTKVSNSQPYWVISQRDSTRMGESVTEFWCVDVWAMLDITSVHGDSFEKLYESNGQKIRSIMLDVITKDPDFVFTFNNSSSTYIDVTAALISGGAGDITVPIETDDILYTGVNNLDREQFDRITIEISIDGIVDGAYTVVWEYSTASGFSSLSNVTDNSTGLTVGSVGGADVTKVIFYDMPTDWAVRTVNSQSFRWIRMRVTNNATPNTDAQIRRIGVQDGWGLQIDDPDGLEDSATLAPRVVYPIDVSKRQVLRDMLDRTKGKLIMTQQFFVFDEFVDAPGSTDYTYDIDGTHTWFTDVRERVLVIPNRVVATSAEVGSSAPTISADQDNAASIAAIGVVPEFIVDPAITSTADANARALRRLNRYVQEAYQGEIDVPIHIGQETWDYIEVIDDRLSVTYKGRVGRITRTYDQQAGTYRAKISMGIKKSFSMPDAPEVTPATEFEELGISTDPAVLPISTPSHPRKLNLQGLPTIAGLGQQALLQGLQPFQGLVPQSSGYPAAKLYTSLNNSGLVKNDISVGYLAITDVVGGGYKSGLFWNEGTGKIILTEVGVGTALTTFQLDNIHTFNLDASSNISTMGRSGNSNLQLEFTMTGTGYISPVTGGSGDLGSVNNYWGNAHVNAVHVTTLQARGAATIFQVIDRIDMEGNDIKDTGDLLPEVADTSDIGSLALPFKEGFFDTGIIMKERTDAQIDDPDENDAHLYIHQGTGDKQELRIKWDTNVVLIIATEL